MPASCVDDFLDAAISHGVYEMRRRSHDCCELVIAAANLDAWMASLRERLGAPRTPDEAAKQSLAPHGGVFGDQLYFEGPVSGGRMLAMLWPWKNGVLYTLKLISAG